jgi:hypothetical protein
MPNVRIIEGKLDRAGLLLGESRVTDWSGGELRVVVRRPQIIAGKLPSEFPIEETTWGGGPYVPFGEGFALPSQLSTELVQEAPGLVFEIAVRDGRPRCVAIRSTETGPPITTTLLKSSRLPAIGRLVREAVAERAVRLVRTVEGEVIGVLGVSTPDLFSTFDERTADIEAALADLEIGERRWRMTDEHLEEVASVYREAYAKGDPTARAIAERWTTTEQNARRWVSRARGRGFLPPTEPRRARG